MFRSFYCKRTKILFFTVLVVTSLRGFGLLTCSFSLLDGAKWKLNFLSYVKLTRQNKGGFRRGYVWTGQSYYHPLCDSDARHLDPGSTLNK